VSFSGGKDSTVLLHIARQIYPNIPAVFSDTGLEYSAIREFVKTWDNVDIIRPDMNFGQVITTYGYPIIGKEVAEAIYYARRIRPSGEREIEVWRKRRELLGQRQRESKASCWATERLEEAGTVGAEEPLPADNVQENRDQRSEKSRGEQSWEDWRRGCL
jgi:3'-phosphoadenosine 5'-phosphosulfate sulfotransferase (PAPS reductase)/FAD synthetase